MSFLKKLTLLGGMLLIGFTSLPATAADMPAGMEKVQHIVVIYLENRGFDHMYGLFPGANGLSNAGTAALQTDRDGKPYATLPALMLTKELADTRFPKNLPNQPFDLGDYVQPDQKTSSPIHRFYQNQMQISGGRNDRFVANSSSGALVMGYYDGRTLPLWKYAEKYTLADNFYQAAFGGSFLNHFWLICACTPRYPDAPHKMYAILNDNGNMLKDGVVTPDGYAVNTIQSYYMPHSPNIVDQHETLPPQSMPTIGDRLTEKHIAWAWYSGGWNDALSGWPAPSFQFNHQPFVYFSNYADGTEEKARHLKDETDFLAAIEHGTLPPVSFYKPIGINDEHPDYADVMTGEKHIYDIVSRIENSALWANTVIIITYDENGGFWDHASPPRGDRWGPGTRVPTIIVSPFAKRGQVDHTLYDTTSILKFIETRFGLKPLGERDTNANGLLGAFNFY